MFIYTVSLYPLCISTHRYHIHILHLYLIRIGILEQSCILRCTAMPALSPSSDLHHWQESRCVSHPYRALPWFSTHSDSSWRKIKENVTVASAVTLKTENGASRPPGGWACTNCRIMPSESEMQGIYAGFSIWISNRRAAAIASATETDKSPLQGFLHGQMRN